MILELEGISKAYGSIRALDALTLAVDRDEIVAVLGPNGAGKTTALEIALGLRSADAGSARLFGGSPRTAATRLRVGATPQDSGFPDALRVDELIAFAAAHYRNAPATAATIEAFGLTALASRRAGELSGGESRRVALALAFAGAPEFVVLDEPTTGLDVESRRRLWDTVKAQARGRSILFTTHYLEEAEALATRIVVIDRGCVLFDGDPALLRARFGTRRISYTGADGPVTIASADTDAYVRDLVASGAPFADLEIVRPSLEEAFLSITGGSK
ncbi:MAG TPA: ABC transporter ATP-binding protein [Candidatus Acidoferrales bacterium]|nr:ABC transporter ATP-binding protein [Candidatus Acidoferrales bacterium]